tara:strand:- start:296 stop:742 length:447 start_codon:yes stop_codon:yes gene_type:complete
MIIECPNCNKKFEIDQNLVPTEGRLLQCGSCSHKWFFKLDIVEEKNEEKIKINVKPDLDISKEDKNLSLNTESEIETEVTIKTKKKDKVKINYLNILLVIIITFVAFILVLDTFKNQLISIFPNISFFLDNLYQSLEDIKLFVLDLIK